MWARGEWGGLWMLLWMAVFWSAIAVLVVRVARAKRESAAPARSAMSILEERFARGEIDAEEFQQRRTLLNGE